MKCSKFSWGIVTGITIGFLFAPRKGSETREKLTKCCGSCKNRLEQWFADSDEEINELKLMLANVEIDLTEDSRHKLIKLLDKIEKNKKHLEENS